MSSFEEHLRADVGVHAAATTLLAVGYVLGGFNLSVVLAAAASLPWTVVGAAFPDIDHKDAKPFRYLKHGGAAVWASSWLVAMVRYSEGMIRVVRQIPLPLDAGFKAGLLTAGITVGCYKGWKVGVEYIRPTHRTVTHRVRVGVVTTGIPIAVGGYWLAIFGLDPTYVRLQSGFFGLAYFLGFLSHLYEDGFLCPNTPIVKIIQLYHRRFD